jgi:transposase
MAVMIGVDPHKRSHTAVMVDEDDVELGRLEVRASGAQVGELLGWAGPFGPRTWAIESADGLGYLLGQQLVAAGDECGMFRQRCRRGCGSWGRAGRTRTT